MTKPRRLASNTADSAVRAFRSSSKKLLQPPADMVLRGVDRPHWERIVRARTREEWSDHDLSLGLLLARSLTDFEAEDALLKAELVDHAERPRHARRQSAEQRVARSLAKNPVAPALTEHRRNDGRRQARLGRHSPARGGG